MLTIATHRRRVQIDYGVLHFGTDGDDQRVVAFEEKPEMALERQHGHLRHGAEVLGYIPATAPFDFPDLVQALLDAGSAVGVFDHDGLWLDIGRHEDYEKAVELWAHGAQLVAQQVVPSQ